LSDAGTKKPRREARRKDLQIYIRTSEAVLDQRNPKWHMKNGIKIKKEKKSGRDAETRID
jgi:hypothetical protein